MSLNVWAFTGRLGRDAEIRHLSSGTSVLEFSPAVDVGYGDKKTTLWPKCSLFGDRGPKVAPYLIKGQQVAVSGEVQMREWTDKDGGKRTSLEVRVNAVELIGSKRDDAPAASQQTQRATPPQTPAASPRRPPPNFDDMDDDSIPF